MLVEAVAAEREEEIAISHDQQRQIESVILTGQEENAALTKELDSAKVKFAMNSLTLKT